MDDEYQNNWDLNAVVRGCSNTDYTGYCTSDLFRNDVDVEFSMNSEDNSEDISFLNDLEAMKINEIYDELDELCKPFFSKPEQEQQITKPCNQLDSQSTPRSRKRKNQQKKEVCQVPVDEGGVASDKWAWRKYGQKPIKGSPYPRGYYRCSSSKACLARKQVERSYTDPAMLTITYTGEHNHPEPAHRNSLAGTTRTKFKTNLDRSSVSDNSNSSNSASTDQDIMACFDCR